MSSTIFFYFSFKTNAASTSSKTFTMSTHPCPSSIEAECIKNNMYSSWDIGAATCYYKEYCGGTANYCSGGCSGNTCREKSYTGVTCKSYAGEGRCGCTISGATITRKCAYTCYNPPTSSYYPGATSLVYVSGRKDNNDTYYVFKALYNLTLFTTPEQLVVLETTLSNNKDGLSSTYLTHNDSQLVILKNRICTATNLLKSPCTTYCKVNKLSGQLPTSNCKDAWNNLCAYSNNIASTNCEPWCAYSSSNESNCKNIYLTYCNQKDKFSSSLCKDFFKTQYISNQLSDPVMTSLKANCSGFADANGNIIDSDGKIVPSGTVTDKYPVNTCACFLPDNVYNVFYDKTTESNPDLRKFFTVNQCSYPDCANASAIHPQILTCPDVAVTSCIVNNTVGGNVVNSNFNIVNNCITQVENTGNYTNNNSNIAPTETPVEKSSKAEIPPAAFEFVDEPPVVTAPEDTITLTKTKLNPVTLGVSVPSILICLGMIIAFRDNVFVLGIFSVLMVIVIAFLTSHLKAVYG